MRFHPIVLVLLFPFIASANGLKIPYSSAYLSRHPNKCAFVEFSTHCMMQMALYGEHVAKWPFPENGSPPHFYVVAEGSQTALRERSTIESVKEAFKTGEFEYDALDARIGGFYDGAARTYILEEGRHRLNAAVEYAHESGDWRPFITFINNGRWDFGVVPKNARSLHFRSTSAPLKEISSTLEKITPPQLMPSQNSLIRFFQGR